MIVGFFYFFVANQVIQWLMYILITAFYKSDGDIDYDSFLTSNDLFLCLNMLVLTAVVIYQLISLRKELREAFNNSYLDNDDNDVNDLTVKTVELYAQKPHDEDPRKVLNFFTRLMQDPEFFGQPLSAVVIPDYSDIIQLENQRQHMIMRYVQFKEKKPLFACGCFAKKHYLMEEELEKKIDEIDFKLDQALNRELDPTRVSFVHLDSLKTVINVNKKMK